MTKPGADLLEFPPDSQAKTQKLLVAEKIIADISTGIYRTPASALKELVANAYDAEATEVRIATGAPKFDHLVIRDNGSGMSLDRFLDIIQHIGGSWKRIENPGGVTPTLKRPIIGRIGIGLLAVAQLGQRFYVSSTTKGSTTRFLAEIDLTPFHKDDAALQTMRHAPPSETAGNPEKADKKVEIGVVRYVDGLPERRDSQFTVITVLDPKQGLVSELHGQLRTAIGADALYTVDNPASDFPALADAVLKGRRGDAVLDSYQYLLWELGLMAPVPYMDGDVFDSKRRAIERAHEVVLPAIKKFQVFVDNYDIRRPIRYPNQCAVAYGGPDPIVYPIHQDSSVAGRRLYFTGYVYAQKPRIDPIELQGVQIRIRNVGIGGFDKTWMGYPFNEAMKFGQVTGELFVHDGLESALNIDRASFRETDPHYLALRAFLWTFLRQTVFPDFKVRQAAARKKRDTEDRGELEDRFETALAEAPETVSVHARLRARQQPALGPKTRGGRDAEESEARSDLHEIVAVEGGEVTIEQAVFSKAASNLSAAAKQRLLRVCVALAAYGVWDRLSRSEAEALISTLALAIEL